ncbi:hypothetical protein C8R45DRAFT_1013268 [Mycena sanguinolenta]|nr:hypothetical protein C8R45DRAFT_1013268 [Mycena sanguinolenta]
MRFSLVLYVLGVASAVAAQSDSASSSSVTTTTDSDSETGSATSSSTTYDEGSDGGFSQTPPSRPTNSPLSATSSSSSFHNGTNFPSGPHSPTFASGSTATSVFFDSSAPVSRGPIIAAAVGGSIASSLVVIAGVLFCLRTRYSPRAQPSSTPDIGSDDDAVAARCTALEREVGLLRERLARLERRESYPRSTPALLYTNEKDGQALDGKVAKDHPPIYID